MVLSTDKGKGKAIDLTHEENELVSEQSDSTSSSSSDSDSSSDSESESEDEPTYTKEDLDALFEKALKNAEAADQLLKEPADEEGNEEEVIILADETQVPLPSLRSDTLPKPYIELGAGWADGPSAVRDPEIERIERETASTSAPAAPLPPPELSKSGKAITKKEKKALRAKTAGKGWFDLPAPPESELPRLYREVEALRLRNQLDPKRFYKKDEGEGKGIKGLPKYFAIGTILPTTTPFGTASSDNLTRANRKRTLVDELVDDAEAKRYAKKKFEDLQSTRGAKGRNTLRAKQALRKPKW